ncbi:MAG: Ig-like domain-containing protein [Planctomycetota bacterium]
MTASAPPGAPGPAVLLLAALAGACSSGGGGGGEDDGYSPGDEVANPDGSGTFFLDPHEGGSASRLTLEEMFWGRLVDIHDVDEEGEVDVTPAFRDFVINENIQSDGTNYELSTNPITQKTRLIIQRTKGAPDSGGGTFDDLLRRAVLNLPPIVPKNDDGSSSPPFSFLTRNPVLVVRFNDLLDDSLEAEIDLPETVKVLTDYPPIVPFTARLFFDPNHGGIDDGAFHSTRLLIDMTVSEAEAASMSVLAPINSLGLPPSISTLTDPNVSVRFPTALDYGSGQFELFEGLHGATVAYDGNGPRDSSSPTRDIVRAMRSGNRSDLNNGFLLDLNSPEVLGGWPIDVNSITPLDPSEGGVPGFDFILLEAAFETVCLRRPDVGDIFAVNSRFMEVTRPAAEPQQGVVRDVYVHVLSDDPVTNPNALLGGGLYLSTYDPAVPVDEGCWITFAPQPGIYPASNVSPSSQILVRFSEPMDPQSILPFDTLIMVRGDVNTEPTATAIVVGDVQASSDLKEYTYTPALPFAHTGQQDVYNLDIVGTADGITDLAGNPLARDVPKAAFDIDENAPLEANGGVVMRFSGVDEVEPRGPEEDPIYDVRGQIFFGLDEGILRPRSVQYISAPADRTNPVPSIMIPFPPGVQTPLSALGSKLQTVWRYCDLGWNVLDETKYNMDVLGLSWSPIGGQVIADYFELFEIRLSHSVRLPDEYLDPNLLPMYPSSGVLDAPALYTENVLSDPLDPQVVMHNRALGYVVNPVDKFVSTSGTFLMPFPLNRAGDPNVALYIWRNTAVRAQGGPLGAGIPLAVEVNAPLYLYGNTIPPVAPGFVAPVNQVPSFGLPLLMEYRCFPSDSGLGLNAVDISLAINSSARPNFRAFSTGGTDQQGNIIRKNPDLELTPSGGYNPGSNPPGAPTALTADNSFYIGQLDMVVRISRAHTIWIDTLLPAPDYMTPIVEPRSADQPAGTNVVVEFRGATGIFGQSEDQPFDAEDLDPYGEPLDRQYGGTIVFLNDDPTWKSDVDEIDGSRFLQMRFSFFSNIDSGLGPVLSAVGVAFANQ